MGEAAFAVSFPFLLLFFLLAAETFERRMSDTAEASSPGGSEWPVEWWDLRAEARHPDASGVLRGALRAL